MEACVALEKNGDFGNSLKVFEEFIDHNYLPGNLVAFVKERWLVLKEEQAKSSRGGGAGAKIRRERTQKAKEWSIDWHNLSSEVPTLPLSNQEFILSPDTAETPEQLRQEIEEILTNLSQQELKDVKHYLEYLHFLRRTKLH